MLGTLNLFSSGLNVSEGFKVTNKTLIFTLSLNLFQLPLFAHLSFTSSQQEFFFKLQHDTRVLSSSSSGVYYKQFKVQNNLWRAGRKTGEFC